MSNYSRGRDLEYKVKQLFEENGWDVLRGSSSKGTVANFDADLIATKIGTKNKDTVYMVLLQAKRSKKR